MYSFVDTTQHTTSNALPSEAVSINGVYIENVIDGYRTLYVTGRETLTPDIQRGEVGVRNGSYLKSKRFPERILTVGYQIIAESNTAFNTAFRQLNEILNTEDAEIIIADEADKFMVGTPCGYGEIEAGQLSVKGEYQIVCCDPFKYSVTEYLATATDDTASIDYDGTYPAKPVIEVQFYESATADDVHGDCGFVAIANQNASVLQFGDVAQPDDVAVQVEELVEGTETTWNQKKTLINEPFNNTNGWTINDGYTEKSTYVKTGTATAGTLGGTDKALKASSYGATSNSQWHGITAKKTIPSDGGNPATTGAKNWEVHGTLKFASNKTAKTGKKEKGYLNIFVMGASEPITEVALTKNDGSDNGTVTIYVGGNKVKTFSSVDFSYYNKRFGFKKKSKDKRPCNFDIIKTDKKISFDIGGLTFSYNYVTEDIAKAVSFYLAQWGSKPVVSNMGIFAVKLISTSVAQTKTTQTWQELTQILDVENTFTTNDLLIADTSDGSVRLINATANEESDGGTRPDLGALGNDWESFGLEQGTNTISMMYSDWVADAYKPTMTVRYRKRYL